MHDVCEAEPRSAGVTADTRGAEAALPGPPAGPRVALRAGP